MVVYTINVNYILLTVNDTDIWLSHVYYSKLANVLPDYISGDT